MVVVPIGGEALVLDADLQRVIVFQEAQGRATQDAEVGVGMAPTQTTLILLERHIELLVRQCPDGHNDEQETAAGTP